MVSCSFTNTIGSALKTSYQKLAERSGTVGGALNWGLKGYWYKPNSQQSLCVVFLSKTLYPLLSTGSTQEDPS